MLSRGESATVYLACGSTDLRKSIDGLAALVSQVFELDLFSNSLFVFCNRGQDKLKILVWDTNGFWLYYRRLERGRFRWPQQSSDQPLAISRRQLQWLLDGLTLEQDSPGRVVAYSLLVAMAPRRLDPGTGPGASPRHRPHRRLNHGRPRRLKKVGPLSLNGDAG